MNVENKLIRTGHRSSAWVVVISIDLILVRVRSAADQFAGQNHVMGMSRSCHGHDEVISR